MRALLVDKIIQCEPGTSITGIKNVTMSENFLQDHFPGFPVMPGVLQLEAVFQLASWLIFATSDFTKKGRPSFIKSVKFKDFVLPGDQLLITLQITSTDTLKASFDAKIVVNNKLKTEIRQGHSVYTDVSELEDPEAARNYFLFLTGKMPTGGYVFNRGDYFMSSENSSS
jgi:3-hydroxyacyl-[acyl-carrier-protein] dehydratase